METNPDKLALMFELRENFMLHIEKVKPGTYSHWPVDISKKESQQHIRDLALKGVEEMFEALQHLKNWKPHKSTENTEFNSGDFLEEVVDAFNYFFSMLIVMGYDADDVYKMYRKKDKVIHDRLKNDY